MEKYQNYLADTHGKVIAGASVVVSQFGGGAAVIYSDNGVTIAPQPLITNQLGYFSFYAADGHYTLEISIGGVLYATISDVLLEDPADNPSVSLATLAAPGGSALVGYLAGGAGAIATTAQAEMRRIIRAKNFGVTFDGVTNDTAAMNLALAEANTLVNGQYGVLVLEPGTTLITPGGMSNVFCDIDGPRTTIKAASNVNANLLTIGQTAALVDGQRINIFSLRGFGFNYGGADPRFGNGLGFNAAAGQFLGQMKVDIFFVEGFLRGINGDCSSGFHIGTNIFNINTLWYCTRGIYSNSGNLEFENNIFNVNYQTFCAFNVDATASGTAHNVQNTYHIHCLELHTLVNTNGFNLAGANTNNNLYIVDAIYYNANTQWIVVSDGLATRNEFRLPGADFAKIAAVGNLFKLDGHGNLNDVQPARTVAWGPSPAPVTGTWQAGDRYFVNNPSLGGVASYRYVGAVWVPETVSGNTTYTPTATLGANAAASTQYQAFWTRIGNTVTVWGSIDITATAGATATLLELSLPVASNLTVSTQLAGTLGGIITNTMSMGYINGSAANDRAILHLSPSTTANTNYSYSFAYPVLP